ncbi:MAG: hypothetical protein FWC64_02120 [Treponema sp.]|nr:hypothetical protein [Treponema sp.]
MRLLSILLGLALVVPLAAQEEGGLDWDIAGIFYTPPPEAPVEPPPAAGGFSPLDMLFHPGVTFEGAFEFAGGIVPGWWDVPWFPPSQDRNRPEDDNTFSWGAVVRTQLRFGIDAQVSQFFRVRTFVSFTLPGNDSIELGEFFFDYNMFDRFFFRGGRFNHNWGISRNFAFTNLLVRVPDGTFNRKPFILRADIPVGIGGFQFLALTRTDLFGGAHIYRHDLGYGGKFNLALPRADIDIGAFYQEQMPFRSFLSLSTTIGRTEWYTEWLAAIDATRQDGLIGVGGAANLGFVRDFFRNRLTVNGEVFFNTEQGTYWFRPETSINEPQTFLFNDGLNLALNLIYRFRGRSAPRLFVQAFYAPEQWSGQVVPGFRLTPWEHLEFYFAVPMAIGDADGHYFANTADPHPRFNRPFTFVMLVTLRGNIRTGQNL